MRCPAAGNGGHGHATRLPSSSALWTARVVRSQRGTYMTSRWWCVSAAAVVLALTTGGVPQGQGTTLVDHVNPRPRLLFAPGEYGRFVDDTTGVRQRAFDRLTAEVAERGVRLWNERDLQLESQALVARVLLDRGDGRGADVSQLRPPERWQVSRQARLRSVPRQPRSRDGRCPLGAGDGVRARLALPVLDSGRTSCDRTVARDRAHPLGRHEPPAPRDGLPVP